MICNKTVQSLVKGLKLQFHHNSYKWSIGEIYQKVVQKSEKNKFKLKWGSRRFFLLQNSKKDQTHCRASHVHGKIKDYTYIYKFYMNILYLDSHIINILAYSKKSTYKNKNNKKKEYDFSLNRESSLKLKKKKKHVLQGGRVLCKQSK